jgi:hypothetical protein
MRDSAAAYSLWCHSDKCQCLRHHTQINWRERVSPLGRRITAVCSFCGRRDRDGYVVWEPERKESST